MSRSPWDAFESAMPDRDFTAAGEDGTVDKIPEPRDDIESILGLGDDPALNDVRPTEDDATDQWGRPPIPDSVPVMPADVRDDDWGRIINPVPQPAAAPSTIPYEEPPRGRNKLVIVAGAAVGALILAGGVAWGVISLGGGSEPVAAETPTPTPTEAVIPEPPRSDLSADPKNDLSFRADLSSSEDLFLSNITAGFSLEGSGWTKDTAAEAKGYTSYSQNGCSVSWTQRDASFGTMDNDYSASISLLEEITKSDDFEVAEYGYWTPESADKPVGKTEVVETEAYDGEKPMVMAVRAIADIEQASLVWLTCDDPEDLDSFVDGIRSQVGFILVSE